MRILVLSLSLLSATGVVSANWPSWRGPSGDGVSAEKNLPIKWSQTENVAWKLALPQWSGATPIIWGDIIFLNVAEADGDQLSLWTVNRNNGEVLWKRPLSTGNNKQRKQNMSSPSPVTDGTTVWVMTGTGYLRAFDFKGNELWMRDIQKDYGRFGLNWGYANSPLLADGKIYITSEDGVTSVYRAGPKFALLAENKMDDYTLSSIAVKDSQLFLRTAGWLWVIGHKGGTRSELR